MASDHLDSLWDKVLDSHQVRPDLEKALCDLKRVYQFCFDNGFDISKCVHDPGNDTSGPSVMPCSVPTASSGAVAEAGEDSFSEVDDLCNQYISARWADCVPDDEPTSVPSSSTPRGRKLHRRSKVRAS
eukprot:TRINITY_DN38528_c0_g2_i1.p1 TRINITY_DN38528_c0_g2~~TRINITY_DN38528_c0_g2_i1.p1  ORF type:complete len:144 (+),score=16.30 TRINITY_DN38528_c0_g2_i1:48-434(+)